MLSSLQLARLVQIYLAEPGASVDEKAALIGVRRNTLLRAARGAISRTARARLLAHFAATPAQPAPGRSVAPTTRHRKRKQGFT